MSGLIFAIIDCTDLRQENFLMRIFDDKIFRETEEREVKHPSPRKIVDQRVVHTTPLPVIPENFAHAVLCDFGEARPGDTQEPYFDDIQPFPYRAPEVILDIPFSYPTDIWNAGVMVCWRFLFGCLWNAQSLSAMACLRG